MKTKQKKIIRNRNLVILNKNNINNFNNFYKITIITINFVIYIYIIIFILFLNIYYLLENLFI